MRQVFIRELSYHTPQSLAVTLKVNLETAALCIEVLTTRGVLKLKADNNISEYDVTDSTSVKGTYQFVYVGLAIFEDIVIIVYPKYMKERPDAEKMRKIFRVIRKASGSLPDIAAMTEDGIRSNDRVALMLSLIEMYGDYGIYSNYQTRYATNGMGAIAWDRTIDKYDPFFDRGAPVYFDCETRETYQDQTDFVTRLQKSVLTIVSNYLEKGGLLELLALDVIELSDELLEDFGDKEFIDYRLDQELSVQFVTWKQQLIQLLKRFVNDDEVLVQSDDVICLGTSSFYHLWEQACKTAFADKLDKPLSTLGLSLNEYWKARGRETLLGIVPRPVWYANVNGDYTHAGVKETLIPDTVAFWEDDDEHVFAILDAKYYVPTLTSKEVKGVPGVESITKQHLYQAAYKRFVLDNDFDRVVNAFIVPGDDGDARLLGMVEFPDIFEPETAPFANGVTMWQLSAEIIWDCYLRNSKLPDCVMFEISEQNQN